jgi:hypothetical protein
MERQDRLAQSRAGFIVATGGILKRRPQWTGTRRRQAGGDHSRQESVKSGIDLAKAELGFL